MEPDGRAAPNSRTRALEATPGKCRLFSPDFALAAGGFPTLGGAPGVPER